METVYVHLRMFLYNRMGLIVENYTTQDGTLIPELYMYVYAIRIIKDISRTNYKCLFHMIAHKNTQENVTRSDFITMPSDIIMPQIVLPIERLLEKNNYTIAYETVKERLTTAGYTFRDA